MSYLPVLFVMMVGITLTVWIAKLRYMGRPVPQTLQVGRLICAAACAVLIVLSFKA